MCVGLRALYICVAVVFNVQDISARGIAPNATEADLSPVAAVEEWVKSHFGVTTLRVEQVGMYLPVDEADSPFQIRKKSTLCIRWPDALLELREREYRLPNGDAIPLEDDRMPANASLRVPRFFSQCITADGSCITRFDDGSTDSMTGPMIFAEHSPRYFEVAPWVAARYVGDIKPSNLEVHRVDGLVVVDIAAEHAKLELGLREGVLVLEAIERANPATGQLSERIEFRGYHHLDGVPFSVPSSKAVYRPLFRYDAASKTLHTDGPLRLEGVEEYRNIEVPSGIGDSYFKLPLRESGSPQPVRINPSPAGQTAALSKQLPAAVLEGPLQPIRSEEHAATVNDRSWRWIAVGGFAFVLAGIAIRIRQRA